MKRKRLSRTQLFLSPPVTALVSVFVAGLFFLKPGAPCANSHSCSRSFQELSEAAETGMFEGQRIPVPTATGIDSRDLQVQGIATASGEKRIMVDLTKQMLYAYQGDTESFTAYVSSGKWYPTPTGEFKIWHKVKSTRMSGGSGADYYDLPNVPYTMFFANSEVKSSRGFGLHGAYWHNNFGHAMSHGCINLRQIDAKRLFEWADLGTPVIIYGEAP